MIYRTPVLGDAEHQAIERIEDLQRSLRFHVAAPRRWFGLLRRTAFARAIQGSNTIEGYNVTLDDAVAAVDGDEALGAEREAWAAVVGYRNAMTYVLQLAKDPHFSLNDTLVRGLHYMMMSYDLSKNPGLWRPGSVFVQNDETGNVVYEGPPGEQVPELVREFLSELDSELESSPPLIAAAMAHLNLALIHPFSDGNGRMARCIQTLVLARRGILVPQFSSIEEYLGGHTDEYYDALTSVARGTWSPHNDARPWIRFVLNAHFMQLRTHLRRVGEAQELWGFVEGVARERDLRERVVPALFEAALGRRLTNTRYRAVLEEDVSDAVAGRDLRSLVQRELLVAHGEKRGRFYVGSRMLRDLQRIARQPQPEEPLLFDQPRPASSYS
jgi:Fic family protein